LPGERPMRAAERSAYPPIAAYAIIGNRASAALVGLDGSIDWLCLPYLDSASVFAAILDADRGGRFRVRPAGESQVERRYLGHSPALETTFRTAAGCLRLTDFFPVKRGTRQDDRGIGSKTLIRRVECVEGHVDVEVEWVPRPNYARDDVRLLREGDVIAACTERLECRLAGVPPDALLDLENAAVRTTVPLDGGEGFDLAFAWGDGDPVAAQPRARELLGITCRWWEDWAQAIQFDPAHARWRELMLRSGMVLKLLTHEESGAIAAAPTASLPEEIGGVRNWDYRYCWVRDSAMIARALVDLGHEDDAVAFLEFLETAAQKHRDPARIQVLYGLREESSLTEYTLGHLEGYRGSRPVRIGNAAASQQQHDIYGELLDAALELHLIGVEITPAQRDWLKAVANHTCKVWRDPDRGIWEVRGPDRHFVHSKVMAWVALDRAVRLAEPLGWEDCAEHWREEADAIQRDVLEKGVDPESGGFKQSYENATPDAANLRIPIVGFLPADDPRVLATIDWTLERLTEKGLVYRYLTEEAEDGVGGGEGAFGICTYWLAHALALAGRMDEAKEIFEAMSSHANDVGLLAEEVDPESGIFLGNFPQAFSHVGLINAAHAIGACAARGGKPAGRDEAREP
jgi:GH15 family glucan-1,4-alpha-glucosidase